VQPQLVPAQQNPDIDLHVNEAHSQSFVIEERQSLLGMKEPRLAAFIGESEFVSLGCFCATSNAFAQLGLRQHAYPFDWVRSPAAGIIHEFDTKFSDFFNFASTKDAGQHGISFQNTPWGGSFWHHNIQDPQVRAAFQRRIDRILGNGDVPSTKSRVFVRTMNSSEEILVASDLHQALIRAFPGSKVYLLVLIDMQDCSGPVRLAGPQGDDLLFYRVPIAAAMTSTIDERSHGYWEPIVFALQYWACRTSAVSEVSNLMQIKAACNTFDGGNPATDLYAPSRGPGPTPARLPPPVAPALISTAWDTTEASEAPLPVPRLPVQHARSKRQHSHGKWMDPNGHRHSYSASQMADDVIEAVGSFAESVKGRISGLFR